MKNSIKFLSVLAIMFTGIMNAQQNEMQRAIEKGKSDLVALLTQAGDGFNFGIKPSEVEQANGRTGIPYKEIDFQKLLKYDSQQLEQLVTPTQKYIVPLVSGTNVVTTITLSDKGKEGYKVAELINQQFQNELNMLPAEVRNNDFRDLDIIYVPNLNTMVYATGGKLYTSYNNHSLREPIATETLLKELKTDAVDFQSKYGDLIKKGKLVH